MWKRVLLLTACAACGKSAEKPTAEEVPERPEAPRPKLPERGPAPTADEEPDEPPPPAESSPPVAGAGQCTVTAMAGREFKQVSGGGPSAANVFQWHTPETRQQKGYQDEGFILTCEGSDIRLSIKTSPTAGAAFGAKQYRVADETSPVQVTGTMGNTSIATASGMLNIEKFDDKRIAGRLTLYVNATVPPTDVFKLFADFDFACTGLSGCK